MKQVGNTLYVTLENVWLHKEGETITMRKDGILVKQPFPIHMISEIICYGYGIIVSPQLAEHCSENNVTISYLDSHGKFMARFQGATHGNVLLRRAQYRYADDEEKRLLIAKCCVSAKIKNHKTVLLRSLRNHSDNEHAEEIKSAISNLEISLNTAQKCSKIDILRGIEGSAAETYFSVFDHLILSKEPEFRFNGRTRRPPLDRVNALLSYAYSLLAIDIRSALETVGLDPYVGYLHTERPGRPSLALDMMEEFRGPIVDRIVLSLINLKQVSPKGFKIQPNGQTDMTDETRKVFLKAWQDRKKEEIEHPIFDKKMQTGLVYIAQAQLLARFIRGESDYYPAFIWR